MAKFKIGIKFDKQMLLELKDDENSGVSVKNCVRHLSLHPIHLNNVFKSIKEILNDEITKYNKSYEGILLGYQNIKIPSKSGMIDDDSCYIHVDVQADFFIFTPKVGRKLQGIVNRTSKDHVGVLVYNAFNVSIPKQEDDIEWLGNCVSVGSKVLFRLTNINLSSYLPHLKGELISISTFDSEITSEIKVNEENSEKHIKRLNKKIVFTDDDVLDEISVTNEIQNEQKLEVIDESQAYQHKKKKKKHGNDGFDRVSKKKNNEELLPLESIKTEIESNDESKKSNQDNKKKSKKSKRTKKELNKHEVDISMEDLNLTQLYNESK